MSNAIIRVYYGLLYPSPIAHGPRPVARPANLARNRSTEIDERTTPQSNDVHPTAADAA